MSERFISNGKLINSCVDSPYADELDEIVTLTEPLFIVNSVTREPVLGSTVMLSTAGCLSKLLLPGNCLASLPPSQIHDW